MKRYLMALVLGSASFVAHSEARVVELKAEAIAGKTHWTPERIEAVQGETFKLDMKHDLPEGFAFHGVEIPALGLRQQVNRGEHVSVEVKIPADMKPGEYPIRCHFHAGHVGSTLVVVAAPTSAKKSEVKKK
jgi:plastocyanin